MFPNINKTVEPTTNIKAHHLRHTCQNHQQLQVFGCSNICVPVIEPKQYLHPQECFAESTLSRRLKSFKMGELAIW